MSETPKHVSEELLRAELMRAWIGVSGMVHSGIFQALVEAMMPLLACERAAAVEECAETARHAGNDAYNEVSDSLADDSAWQACGQSGSSMTAAIIVSAIRVLAPKETSAAEKEAGRG